MKKQTEEEKQKSGYGKHDYREIDPTTINPADYAQGLRGEEQYFGDVREYESASNRKHPENTMSLEWASRIGTKFETEAEGYEGKWEVIDLPKVKDGKIHLVVKDDLNGMLIPAHDLGIVVDYQTNLYKQVVTKLIMKGKVAQVTRRADA